MKVIIAGDFLPFGRISDKLQEKESFTIVDDEIKAIICDADYSIVNLESPVANENCKPIEKTGPCLKTNSLAIELLKNTGFKAVTLANNHFLDYGEEGAKQTLCCLKEKQIDYVGGGETLDEAQKPLLKTINGVTIAFINCCEKEFSIATKKQAGSNPLDDIKIYYSVQQAKKKADKVIVIVHGGIERYSYPTPRMVDTYRFFIDCGADVVLNHHQHWFSGFEDYKGKPIFYGLGNFCYDCQDEKSVNWNIGYMVMLNFNNEKDTYEVLPYIQCDKQPIVRKMSHEEVLRFQDGVNAINAIIQNRDLLNKQLQRFVKETSEGYKLALEPYTGRISRKLYSLGLLPSFCKGKKKVLLKNLLRCESHYERLLASLEE